MLARFSLIDLLQGVIRRLIVLCKLLMESKPHILLPSISREQLELETLHKNKQLNQLKKHVDRSTKQTVWLQETDVLQAKEFECWKCLGASLETCILAENLLQDWV